MSNRTKTAPSVSWDRTEHLWPRPAEHPDDVASRKQSEASAATVIDAFTREEAARLRDCILTYADDDAHELLAQLRERFWGGYVP